MGRRKLATQGQRKRLRHHSSPLCRRRAKVRRLAAQRARVRNYQRIFRTLSASIYSYLTGDRYTRE
jgi:hypothetical protein